MSYSGYTECLCFLGHRFTKDAFDEEERCCAVVSDGICGAPIVWTNEVDTTNGFSQGKIEEKTWKQFEISPEIRKTCDSCGHSELVSSARYAVPTEEEHFKMRKRFEE